METYEKIKKILEDTSPDISKVGKGNKAAGIRVRKVLQEVIANCKSFRKEISEITKK
jgi:hypothetical protein